MSGDIEEVLGVQEKIRERLDIEQWALEHLMKMSDVQAYGELGIYESMLNTFILSLNPHWPEGFKARWDTARIKGNGPKFAPDSPIHKERLTDKEMLKAELIDVIGIGFTKKKKGFIKGGVRKLWEQYPPWIENKEPTSES